MQARRSRGPVLWPLLLAIVGIILLLDNFLLLGGFDAALLWPVVLVVLGAQILLRGDLLPGTHHQTFGITRGSVEAAILEISAGEIDVHVRALQRQGRLIAGQYAAQSRPQMQVHDTLAHLKLARSATPWLSFSNWEMGLAKDLPWQLYITTHLGQVNVDLSELIVENGVVATGFGDIRVICPYEVLNTIALRSTLGSIQVVAPYGHRVQITAREGTFFGVHVDTDRYEQIEPGVYLTYDAHDEAPLVRVEVSGTFGDAYLA